MIFSLANNDVNDTEPRLFVFDAEAFIFGKTTSPSRAETLAKQARAETIAKRSQAEPRL